ncbi:MAG TPA: hypothetical protein VF335_07780, partial [Chitinivibrionales bacterium]
MHQSVERFKTALTQSRLLHFPETSDGPSPLQRVRSYTHDVDAILIEIFSTLIRPSGGDIPVCLIALGGYGRAELCPYSDIDLLILHEGGPQGPQGEIAAAVRFFWDIGLTMGCVVRTVDECAKILGQDMATDTAFLENRFLAGDKGLRQRLTDKVIAPYFAKRKKHYIDEMRRVLHEQLYAPESALYHVEPDLKNGACTLRDCHRLLWAERLRVGLSSMEQLQSRSKFTARQTRQFIDDYGFIIGMRSALHRMCGRRMDIAEAALQPQLATWCGFRDEEAGLLM